MKTLKDLSVSELRELIKHNHWFETAIYEDAYEELSIEQGEEFKLCGADKFDYHDHYSSFYLTCPTAYGAKSPEKLVGKLDEDYMTEEMKPLYKKLCELNDKMEDAEDWDETRPEYDEMRDIADKLAELYTDMLRGYESAETYEACVSDLLERIADGMSYMSSLELDEDGNIIETIKHETKGE
jgi:hypothetical protein